jgi:hypothetical protein
MKHPRSLLFSAAAAAATLGAFAGAPARAAIVQTNAFNNTLAGLPVSSTDLLQTNLASVTSSGGFSGFAANTLSLLTDGLLGTPGAPSGVASVAPLGGTSITFTLDTATNPLGYDITSLVTTASWDTGRDGQEYTVSYSTVAAPATFTTLFTIAQYQSPQAEFNPATTSVTLTENAGSGLLATGVAAVRLTFTNFENSGTAYREIDLIGAPVGAATVPEPSALALFALPLLGVAATRRFRRPCG